MRRIRPIIFEARWCICNAVILFKSTIYRLVVASSSKELHRLVVRILTAVKVLVVEAF
jgi:hypothetical protein